jgi:2-dehydropantoate 2-reductase
MGSLLSYRLRQAGCTCTLLHHRSGYAQRTVIDKKTEAHIDVTPLATLDAGSIKRLLLTTKAGQMGEALALALPFLSDDAVIATTANGLGFEDTIAALAPLHSLHRAVSTAAAFRDTAGIVHVAAVGTTTMGLPTASLQRPDWFSDSLGRLEGWSWDSDVERLIGEKFAVNCIINPLTATLRCRNGELLQKEDARAAVKALCQESEPCLQQLGLWGHSRSLEDAALKICAVTAENRSSMLQDVLAGRPTEIAFLNGELLRRAAILGIDLPMNRTLVGLLN